jgi:hypothetical protein
MKPRLCRLGLTYFTWCVLAICATEHRCDADEKKMVTIKNTNPYPEDFLGAGMGYRLEPTEGRRVEQEYQLSAHLSGPMGISTHPIRKGDVFPFAGWILKAKSVDNESVVADICKEPLKSRDIEIKPAGSLYTVSLGKAAWTRINSLADLRLKEISLTDKEKNAWQAKIDIQPSPGTRKPVVHSVIDVQVGTKFEIGGKEYVITAIVPPDEKQQIVGWIVFDNAPSEKGEK